MTALGAQHVKDDSSRRTYKSYRVDLEPLRQTDQDGREPGGFLDFVIAEYFDPHHTNAAASTLSPPEQRILDEALRTNWKRTLHTISLTRPSKGERILDAGCAAAGTAFRLSRTGANVVAFDINPTRLATGQQILKRLDGRVPLLRASCMAMPSCSATFDKVLCANVFEHLEPDERRAATAEIWRVLKPGGTALIYTGSALNSSVRLWARQILEAVRLRNPRLWRPGFSGAPRSHGDLLTPRQLAHVMRSQGFAVRTVYGLPSVPLAGAALSRFFCAVATKP